MIKPIHSFHFCVKTNVYVQCCDLHSLIFSNLQYNKLMSNYTIQNTTCIQYYNTTSVLEIIN